MTKKYEISKLDSAACVAEINKFDSAACVAEINKFDSAACVAEINKLDSVQAEINKIINCSNNIKHAWRS